MKENALIIDIDEYKKNIPGYDPKKPNLVQTSSAKEANRAFEKALKSGEYNTVIFMAGGSASGKTEFVHSHLFAEKAIIFDSTLSTINGAVIKIKKCKKRNVNIEVIFVIPDSLSRAYIAFLNRDRKIASDIFMKTHQGSREVVLFLAKNDFDAKIKIVKSSYSDKSKKMSYKRIDFINRKILIKFLEDKQL